MRQYFLEDGILISCAINAVNSRLTIGVFMVFDCCFNIDIVGNACW